MAATAETDPTSAGKLREAIGVEAIATWADLREARCDATALRATARSYRSTIAIRPPAGRASRALMSRLSTICSI